MIVYFLVCGAGFAALYASFRTSGDLSWGLIGLALLLAAVLLVLMRFAIKKKGWFGERPAKPAGSHSG